MHAPTVMHTPTMHAPTAMHTPCPPLWTEGMTRACENITFSQIRLRVVKTPMGHVQIEIKR